MTMDQPNAEAPNKGKRSWHCYVEVGQFGIEASSEEIFVLDVKTK